MTLIFVRHGESEGNALGVWQGWADYPLSDLGRRQAAAAAERLAGAGATAIYSSDLARASETGDIIAASVGLPVERREALRERGFGEGQGLTWEQIRERWGPDVRIGEGQIPGEEPMLPFRERVGKEVDALVERHSEDIAICVSHGGVIHALVAHVLGLSPADRVRVQIANCSITIVEIERGRAVIASLSDDCHLRELSG